ncbi:GNAT family N-acetyltransferase [Candidatus Woesearchaeota archaeon]|nr:GNAT family N-acetyltransferase [Candidatus Woesearchaeota archaeon]
MKIEPEEPEPVIRKAKPEDIEEILELFRELYTPYHGCTKEQVVRKDIEDEDIVSYVAVSKLGVVGHGQIRPVEGYPFTDEKSLEISRLGVRKNSQNKGLCKNLVKVLSDVAFLKNPEFVISCFNTASDYSQRALRPFKLTPVMLALGCSYDLAGIGDSNSLLISMTLNKDELNQKTEVYIPKRYCKLAGLVYRDMGLDRRLRKKGDDDTDLSEFKSRLDDMVKRSEEMIRRESCSPNYITINITRPSAFEQIEMARQAGLVVTGLIPLYRRRNGTREDRLIMSYIPHLNLNKVKTAPGLNEKFANTVFEAMYD